ncbi:MAG: leucine-rich repeat domain-containing protein [Gemmatimonadota bacterium]|nr:leucine-rich repeat domain-containing protein [Gemmatimonadota bacterium]
MKWAATLPAGDGAGLRGLYLRDNALTELPPGVFASLPRLRELELTGNGLGELPPGIFDGLANLRRLDLSLNYRGSVRELPPGVFDDLERLEVLDLRLLGKLGELRPDVFERLTQLREPDIGHNFLPALPPDLFRGLGELSGTGCRPGARRRNWRWGRTFRIPTGSTSTWSSGGRRGRPGDPRAGRRHPSGAHHGGRLDRQGGTRDPELTWRMQFHVVAAR